MVTGRREFSRAAASSIHFQTASGRRVGRRVTSSMLTLVTGGARSGKSRFAENLGREASRPVYSATARPEDAEMAARIARHRQDRPAHWFTVEEPLEIAAAVESRSGSSDFLLLDCLTLWLSNLCAAHAQEGDCLESAARADIDRKSTRLNSSHVKISY